MRPLGSPCRDVGGGVGVSMSTEHIPTSRSFAEDAEYTLRRVRGSIVETLGALGIENERPQDIARQLGLHKSLAWKIAKIAQASDPFSLYQHIPGAGGLGIFLEHAQQHGAPTNVLDSVRTSVETLDELQVVHASDRATFELMLSSFARDGQPELLVNHRKQLFRGSLGVWGIQAKTEFLCYLVQPSKPGSAVCDIACLKGFVDLQRLRPDVPWCLCKSRCATDDGETVTQPVNRVPLHEDFVGVDRAPLLPQFCSSPLPELRRVKVGKGFVHDELVEGPIGNTGAVTCVTGEVLREVISNKRSEDNKRGYWTLNVFTPIEWVIFDLIVHESMADLMPPKLSMHSKLGGEPEYFEPGSSGIKLPLTEQMEDLGNPAVVQIPAVPRYREMVSYVFDKLEWDADAFRGYRAAIQYPALSSSVVLEHELLD